MTFFTSSSQVCRYIVFFLTVLYKIVNATCKLILCQFLWSDFVTPFWLAFYYSWLWYLPVIFKIAKPYSTWQPYGDLNILNSLELLLKLSFSWKKSIMYLDIFRLRWHYCIQSLVILGYFFQSQPTSCSKYGYLILCFSDPKWLLGYNLRFHLLFSSACCKSNLYM